MMLKSLLAGFSATFLVLMAQAATTSMPQTYPVLNHAPEDLTELLETLSDTMLTFEQSNDQSGETAYLSVCIDENNQYGVIQTNTSQDVCLILDEQSNNVIDRPKYDTALTTNEEISQAMPVFTNLTTLTDGAVSTPYYGIWHNTSNILCYSNYQQPRSRHYCIQPQPSEATTRPPNTPHYYSSYRDVLIVVGLFIIVVSVAGLLEYNTHVFSHCLVSYCYNW